MIRISDISMPLHYTDEALRRAAAKKLRTDVQTLKKLALVKRSVDARKKQDVRFVVTVDVETDGNEDKLLSRVRDVDLILIEGFEKQACLPMIEVWRRKEPMQYRRTVHCRSVRSLWVLARRACSQAYCSHAPACARSS